MRRFVNLTIGAPSVVAVVVGQALCKSSRRRVRVVGFVCLHAGVTGLRVALDDL